LLATGPATSDLLESKRYHWDGVPLAASTRVCGAERRSNRLADATGTREVSPLTDGPVRSASKS